jgi:hypothetical protein
MLATGWVCHTRERVFLAPCQGFLALRQLYPRIFNIIAVSMFGDNAEFSCHATIRTSLVHGQ